MMNARVFVTLKNGVLDPQGKAIEGALGSLGFEGVDAVRQGKIFDLKVNANSKEEAKAEIAKMCEKLLANTVIENYTIELHD
ncbi:phosphoribosylformylglycinamidine synthase subunit PurS [Maritalea porphyrae]|uniref:phosphoribosylformylglycinamidine synthase subunit PurS n=1 Tax=Maritalea porphyrae TaxID=880732 RepID=UPI0022AF9B07|nr:phosphoribosylformylglycinamidine synthase subunit PurS [Maritalea porphyrae]MCZ4272755.1 phosphoribosylformylglycinamidine synthase subunit PurS [Maritalea porphyrae]